MNSRDGLPLILLLAVLCGGCSLVPADQLLFSKDESPLERQIMARNDKIILVSSPKIDRNKPVLLLLHGATDDPREMMEIAEAFRDRYNVFLYVYNFHAPIEKASGDLVTEFKKLVANDKKLGGWGSSLRNTTVITYSYSAAVFRKTVLLADDPALFKDVKLIQMLPTVGGSYRARGLGSNAVTEVVSKISEPSAVQNPHGPIAEDLWDGEASRKFYHSIPLARMQTILLQDDPNSVAKMNDYEIQRRYENGIGRNVFIMPPEPGVTHENFPIQPETLAYLRRILESTVRPGPASQQGLLALPLPEPIHK